MFDNNVHYIRKELESIYNVVVEHLGKELLSKEIKKLEYEPKLDRININDFIFISGLIHRFIGGVNLRLPKITTNLRILCNIHK